MKWRDQEIQDKHILEYIRTNTRFRNKAAKVIGQMNAAKSNLSAEARSERARKASHKRWGKDQANAG